MKITKKSKKSKKDKETYDVRYSRHKPFLCPNCGKITHAGACMSWYCPNCKSGKKL